MKKKRTAACLLILTMIVLAFFPSNQGLYGAEAFTDIDKDETVYISLESDGSIQNIIVVNHIETPKDGIYVDYGDYSDIENLSGNEVPTIDGDEIRWELTAGEDGFYYAGTVDSAELPWELRFSYTLNGDAVDANDLIGADGDITIKIDAYANSKAAAYFSDNLLLQMTLALPQNICKNIKAADANSVVVGETRNVVYSVLPGQDLHTTVSFTATDLEIDGFTIAMSAYSMPAMDELGELEDGIDQMLAAMDQLIDGTGQLQDGLSALVAGVGALQEGSAALAAGTGEISAGFDQFGVGLQALRTGLNSAATASTSLSEAFGQLQSGGDDLKTAGGQIKTGLTGIKDGTESLAQSKTAVEDNLSQYGTGLSSYANGVSASATGASALAGGLAGMVTQGATLTGGAQDLSAGIADLATQLETIGEMGTALQTVHQAYLGLETGYTAIPGQLDTIAATIAADYPTEASSLTGIANQMETLNTSLHTANQGLGTALGEFSAGTGDISALVDAAALLAQGVGDYVTALDTISQGADDLNSGLSTLSGNSGAITDGYGEVQSAVSDDLFDAIAQIDQGLGETKTGYESYAQGVNTYVDSVGTLGAGYESMKQGLDQMAAASLGLVSGFTGLSGGIEQGLFLGISSLNQGIATLYAEMETLPTGVAELQSGEEQIKDGISEAADEFSAYLEDDGNVAPVSFVAPGKITPQSVQFVANTPNIATTAEPTTAVEEEAETSSLWQKILNLFR